MFAYRKSSDFEYFKADMSNAEEIVCGEQTEYILEKTAVLPVKSIGEERKNKSSVCHPAFRIRHKGFYRFA